MEKDEIRKVLDQACGGRLHHLTDEQRKSINSSHRWVVFQAFMIGLVTAAIAAGWENYLTTVFDTDGINIDPYWSCQEYWESIEGACSSQPGAANPEDCIPYEALNLPGFAGTWDENEKKREAFPALDNIGAYAFIPSTPPDKRITQLGVPGQCGPGTCPIFPKNLTRFFALGGGIAGLPGQDPAEAVSDNWTAAGELEEAKAESDATGEDYCAFPRGSRFCPDRVTLLTDENAANTECRALDLTPTDNWLVNECVEGPDENDDGYPDNFPNCDKTHMNFLILNTIVTVVTIIFELAGLLITAVRSAIRVAASLDLRLVPINKDRAFVSGMLVRAAFEMPEEEEGDMIDTSGGDEGGGCWELTKNIIMALWIKGKVLLTGLLWKSCVGWWSNYDTAHWVKPWGGPTNATMLWDAMMCHGIMKNAEVKAIGVTTSVEIFNAAMDKCKHTHDLAESSLESWLCLRACVAVLQSLAYAHRIRCVQTARSTSPTPPRSLRTPSFRSSARSASSSPTWARCSRRSRSCSTMQSTTST